MSSFTFHDAFGAKIRKLTIDTKENGGIMVQIAYHNDDKEPLKVTDTTYMALNPEQSDTLEFILMNRREAQSNGE